MQLETREARGKKPSGFQKQGSLVKGTKISELFEKGFFAVVYFDGQGHPTFQNNGAVRQKRNICRETAAGRRRYFVKEWLP